MAFYQLEPWGAEADWAKFAVIAATVANSVRDPKKRPTAWKASDFMPDFDVPDDDPDTLVTKLDGMMAMFGGSKS